MSTESNSPPTPGGGGMNPPGARRERNVEAHPVELPPVEPQPGDEDEAQRDANLQMILDLPVDLHVELGQARVTIQNILGFGVGSVVELDRLASEPADIVVNGKLIGQGEVMVINENFGIRITKLVEPEKRIESL
ncbi:MAG: flagellar motor switch protein FliN [Kiritimatiellae bacterium]|nr:flagellar motor switch protein FliN [Kiritimatiellia bacterium]